MALSDTLKFGWKGLPWEGGVTGLYYVRQRWYDPASRGFISEDPAGIAGGMNTYAYADNDPVQGWDPSGAWALHWGIRWTHPWRDLRSVGISFAALSIAGLSGGMGWSAFLGAAKALGAAGITSALGATIEVGFNPGGSWHSAFFRNWNNTADFFTAAAAGSFLAGGVKSIGATGWLRGYVQVRRPYAGFLGIGLTAGGGSVFTAPLNTPLDEGVTLAQHEFGHVLQFLDLSAVGGMINPWVPYLGLGGWGLIGQLATDHSYGVPSWSILKSGVIWERQASTLGEGWP